MDALQRAEVLEELAQGSMFDQGEDLPLFSGTPITVNVKPFEDEPQDKQDKFAECPICFDTHTVKISGKIRACWCAGSQDEQTRAQLLAGTSRQLTRVQRNNPNAYPKDEGDIEKILREAAAVEPIAARIERYGPETLSTVDLLTFLLGEQTSVLASRLLGEFQGLRHLYRASLGQLARIKGMTPRRAAIVQCALALSSRRFNDAPGEQAPIIKSPADAAEIFGEQMRGLDQEEMHVLLIDTKNRVLAHKAVYRGSVNTTLIRVTELFKEAVRIAATALIIAHNHPSGDPTPSTEDVTVTCEIVKAGKLLDIDVLEHLVIGDGQRFVSMKERGLGFG